MAAALGILGPFIRRPSARSESLLLEASCSSNSLLALSLTGLMALGALIALGLVLWRGDLCPGQRSRITTQLFSVWVITGLSLMLAVEAKAVTG